MAGQVGRISGGVLQDNLVRNGIDLNFKDQTTDTALLQLKVNTARIGVNTESPSAILEVVDTLATDTLLQDTQITVANFTIQNSDIDVAPGDMYINAASSINVTNLNTNDININFNTIRTITPNTNLELRPDGIGTVDIHANTNVTGSLHATGNITFGGNLTLGNDDTDSVDFNSDVSSNIVPDSSDTYDLGSTVKNWRNVYAGTLEGNLLVTNVIVVEGTSLALRQGNIFYVAENGNDSNVGDHPQGPFRTIAHALAVADASTAGPVTIHVYPGEYEETLPLVVPQNTTITGEDLRNTIIMPDTSSQGEDVFHLNQNSIVENVTIKNFYYDSINNTGYAFRFASGALINERSPYVRNVSVITNNSGGTAGKGAWIDGSELNSLSTSASMLFHSATFITPSVDCITMTNGVRVEWLNSFTYFANRGLYATQGTAGFANLGSIFGAEVRSIGSACVYGNYGAVADGANTLMYLIGHNFAYIGTGTDSSNDSTLTLRDQEAVELNSGKIYYVSTDARGTFRVGNIFYVDFDEGTTSIDASSIDFSGVSAIVINTAGEITYIDGERVDTGNIRISGNTVTTLAGDLIFGPITGFVDVSSNKSIVLPKGSTIQRINEQSDIRYNTTTNLFEGVGLANVAFNGVFSDNRATKINANNALGNIIFTVNNIEAGRLVPGGFHLQGLYNGNILIENNLITTTVSNSNLELSPDGIGRVYFDDLTFIDGVIDNIANDDFTVYNTGQGYLKFDFDTGLVVPSGTDAERPLSPPIGLTRWNTERDYLEIYNGTAWQRAAGEGEIVTAELMGEILDIYTLVLG